MLALIIIYGLGSYGYRALDHKHFVNKPAYCIVGTYIPTHSFGFALYSGKWHCLVLTGR